MTPQLQRETGMDGQTSRRLKGNSSVVFEKLVHLTVFQSSFLLFLSIDIMLRRHILYDTQL